MFFLGEVFKLFDRIMLMFDKEQTGAIKKSSAALTKRLAIVFFAFTMAFLVSCLPPVRKCAILFAESFICHRQIKHEHWMSFLLFVSVHCAVLCAVMSFCLCKVKRFDFVLKDNFSILFVFCVIAFFLVSNCFIVRNDGFLGYGNQWDFGDFTISMGEYADTDNFYSTNYPPVAVLVYKFFNLFLPHDSRGRSFALNYLVNLYIMLSSCATLVFSLSVIDDSSWKGKLFVFSLFLTGPVLFAYQRLNLILLSLIFVLFYIRFYDSNNKFLKEGALFLLAVAANLKLFPAVFGAILLKEKNWGAALRCFAYGALLFILPAFLTPAAKVAANDLPTGDILSYSNSVVSFVAESSAMVGVSMKAIVHRIFAPVVSSQRILDAMMSVAVALCFVLSLMSFFFARKKYQGYLMLSLLCVFIPTVSYWYAVVFLIVPLLEYYKEREKSYVISICFVCLFGFCCGYYSVLWPHRFEFLLLLWGYAIVSVFKDFIAGRKYELQAY